MGKEKSSRTWQRMPSHSSESVQVHILKFSTMGGETELLPNVQVFFEPNKTKSFFPHPHRCKRKPYSRNHQKKTQLFSEGVTECKESIPTGRTGTYVSGSLVHQDLPTEIPSQDDLGRAMRTSFCVMEKTWFCSLENNCWRPFQFVGEWLCSRS